MSLARRLPDWTDWDVAAYELGSALGLLTGDFPRDNKGVFWTDNPLGNGLHDLLLALVEMRVLERRDEPDKQFRWLGAHRR